LYRFIVVLTLSLHDFQLTAVTQRTDAARVE
jgi:hypothetical protein